MTWKSAFVPLVLGLAAAAGCLDTDEDPDAPRQFVVAIVPEEFASTYVIRWNETEEGEARDLVAEAIESRDAPQYHFPVTERQARLVEEYLRTEWLRSGASDDLGSRYPIEYEGQRMLIGVGQT